MRWRPRPPVAVALLVAVVAAAVVGLPVTDLDAKVPRDLGDPLLNVWALAWESSTFLDAPRSLYRGNIYWPETAAIAYSESMLPLVPVFGLLRLLTGSDLAANALLVYLLVLAAIGAAYLLARRYVRRPATALVAALSYGLGGYVVSHTAQIQLLTLGSFPVVFLLWFEAMERRSWRWALGCGAAVAVGSLASLYYGVALAACLVVLAVVQLVADRRTLGLVALVGVTAAVLAVPGLVVYLDVDERVGLERSVDPLLELEPDDLISAPQQTWLYVDLAHRALGRPAATEHALFPGFTVLALAAAGVVLLVRFGHPRRRELAALGAVGALAFVLALGAESAGVDLPFGWLHDHVAGFDGIRATSRLVVPTLLLLAVLASVALDRLVDALDDRRAQLVALAAASVLVVELWAPSPWRTVEDDGARLAVYEALDEREPGVVLELPMGDPRVGYGQAVPSWGFAEPTRMVHSLVDRNPRVNGYSGHLPSRYLEYVDRTRTFPSDDALALLDELGVRYVVLHTGRSVDGGSQYTDDDVASIVRRLPDGWTAERHGDSWLLARW